jgi:HTH-type transcriptional regulator/antitoxin MqsA
MCDAEAVEEVSADRHVVADDGAHLAYQDHLMACAACGERHYTHHQSLASSRARAGALREHADLLTPLEIRTFRQGAGLTQHELEALLGTGPKTVVRWEKGSVCQSRAADRLLRLLMTNATNLSVLSSRVARSAKP